MDCWIQVFFSSPAAVAYQAGCSSESHQPLLLVAEMIHESKHQLFCILSSLFLDVKFAKHQVSKQTKHCS